MRAARPLPVVVLAAALVASIAPPAAATMPFPERSGVDPHDYAGTLFIDDGACEGPGDTEHDLPSNFGCGYGDWKLNDTRRVDDSPEPSADDQYRLLQDNPQEFYGVQGPGVNRAWEVTTGRPDVVIAVMDSGIRWEEDRQDLLRKHYINPGELPRPQDALGTPRFDPLDDHFDGYDVNHDGVFNVVDYWEDRRLLDRADGGDLNGNGDIDPEDLIRVFSDGIDDDGNGYVDDISGWDFFENDNNPQDDVDYGHGTGEMQGSAAEADRTREGTCPNCMAMSLRVGDSFIADVNHFAEAVVYAVDSGVSVIQEALGTLNHTSFGQAALDYAYRNGVIVNASEADEAAAHHNWPAAYDHTMVVNSIRQASLPNIQPQSTLYVNGCTNFGGYTYVAIPSTSCSSDATGLSSGYSGLLYSAAYNAIDRGHMTPYLECGQDGECQPATNEGTGAPFALSAEEAMQLWRLASDDIDFASDCSGEEPHAFCDDAPDGTTPVAEADNYAVPTAGVPTERYRSVRGWDYFTGYGRINTARLVRYLGIDDDAGADERVYVPRADGGHDPYGFGADGAALTAQDRIPPEADLTWPRWWHQYGYDADSNVLLAPDDPSQPDHVVIHGRVAANRVTHEGGTFDWVLEYAPQAQAAGHPTDAGQAAAGSEERSGGPWTTIASGSGLDRPVEGELGRVPVAELRDALAASTPPWSAAEDPTSEFRPEQHAIRLRVRVIAHPVDAADTVNNEAVFQKQIDVYPAAEVALRDDLGVPITTRDRSIAAMDRLNVDGVGRYTGGAASPTTHDVDGDGRDELVVATSDGVVHAFTDLASGTELPGWPVTTVPYDGITDRLVGDGGTPVDNAYRRGDVTADVHETILVGAPAVADLDDDGTAEVVVADLGGRVYAWRADGTLLWDQPLTVDRSLSHTPGCERTAPSPVCDDYGDAGAGGEQPTTRDEPNSRDWGINSTPAVGDLDPDHPGLELVVGGNDAHVYAWHADGTPVEGWPVVLRDPEKVAAMDPDTRAWTYTDGSGWRIGTKILPGVSLGDLDGDGDLEVVAGVNEEYVETPNSSPLTDPAVATLGSELDSGNTRLYVLHHTGAATPDTAATEATPHLHDQAYVDGWPAAMTLLVTELLPYVGVGVNMVSPILDADGDGTLEIASASAVGPGYVFDHDGTSHYGSDEAPDGQGRDRTLATAPPGAVGAVSDATATVEEEIDNGLLVGVEDDVVGTAVLGALSSALAEAGSVALDVPSYVGVGGFAVGRMGLVEDDDHLTIVGPNAGLQRLLDVLLEARQTGAEDHLPMWNASTGQFEPNAPLLLNDLQFFTPPTIADVDGDGIAEALQGTAVSDLVAADLADTNSSATRWFTGGWTVSAANVGPTPVDARPGPLGLGVASFTREGILRVFPTPLTAGTADGCAALSQWPEYGHDAFNTGNHGVDAERPGPLGAPAATRRGDGRLELAFVATGDDRTCGRASGYEVRLVPGSTPRWNDPAAVALPFEGPEQPAAAGVGEVLVADPGELAPGPHTVMVRAYDDAGVLDRGVDRPTGNGSAVAATTFVVPDPDDGGGGGGGGGGDVPDGGGTSGGGTGATPPRDPASQPPGGGDGDDAPEAPGSDGDDGGDVCTSGAGDAGEFEDVDDGVHAGGIRCATRYGLAQGVGDTDRDGRPEFAPRGTVTRGQVASFLARLALEAGLELPDPAPDAFEDDDASVHRPNIDALAALGVIGGVGDQDGDGRPEYRPDAPVTREQVASLLARLHLEVTGSLPDAGGDPFEDDDGSPHERNIEAMVHLGVVSGRGDTDGDGRDEFAPRDRLRRGQLASLLARHLEVLAARGHLAPGGASVALQTGPVAPGGDLQGRIRTNRRIVSVTADGCGLERRTVAVRSDGTFGLTVPPEQPDGHCRITVEVRTQPRAGGPDLVATDATDVTVQS